MLSRAITFLDVVFINYALQFTTTTQSNGQNPKFFSLFETNFIDRGPNDPRTSDQNRGDQEEVTATKFMAGIKIWLHDHRWG